jgi:hypothetical protein
MYHVVLLIEQELSALDATQITSLHEGIEEPVVYHVLLPVEDPSGQVESMLGTLAAGDTMSQVTLTPGADLQDLQDLQHEIVEGSRAAATASAAALRAKGREAVCEVTTIDPVEALTAAVKEHGARETIILTRPHVVAEFFHRDWTSRARRKLGVPVLHLLEHETFAEQSGSGEGVSGV